LEKVKQMLPVNILACDVLNLTDARYFAARGATFVCLNSRNPEHSLQVEELNAIKEWIEGPQILLFTQNGFETELYNKELNPAGFIVEKSESTGIQELPSEVLKFRIYDVADFHTLAETGISGTDIVVGFDYLILNLRPTGKSVDVLIREGALPILQAVCAAAEVYIDAEVNPENLSEILDEIKPEGWVVHGGLEEKTGVKSFDQLDEFFDTLETLTNRTQ
jgi:phosphoribosylanthranilate isomerase